MIPIKMQMINFGPYEDSTVDFNFKSALIAGELANAAEASNGTGKSTIFQALTWVLTGFSRYKNSSRIIRHNTEQAKVIFDFMAGTEQYRITRGRNRANKVSLDFCKVLADGKIEPIQADTNGQLDDKIAEITKIRYDSFLNTVYFAQNSISEFMYGSASVRQKLVAEILAMDRWNEHAKKADIEAKEAEKTLESVRQKIAALGDPVEKRKISEKALVDATELLQNLKPQLEVLGNEITQLQIANASVENQADLQLKKQALAVEVNDTSLLLSKEQQKIDINKTSLGLLQAKVAQLVCVRPGDRPTKLDQINQRLAKLYGEKETLDSQLKAAESGECTTCGWKYDEAHKSHVDAKKEAIQLLTKRIETGEKALADAQDELKKWEVSNKVFSAATIEKIENDSKIKIIEADIANSTAQKKYLESRLDIAQKALSQIPDVVQSNTKEQLAEKIKQQNELQAKQAKLDRIVIESELTKKDAEEKIKQLEELDKSRQSTEKDLKLFSSLNKHFSKSGIQSHILDTVISELEILSNSFLSKLNHKPFSVSFVTQKLDTKGQAKETFDIEVLSPEGKQSIEDISGGEQFRVAFSVRLALATIQARRQGRELQLLLLDEVSSSLDKRGLETFMSIIRELEKTMKILVITHDDSLKEHFQDIIKVKNNGVSATIEQ